MGLTTALAAFRRSSPTKEGAAAAAATLSTTTTSAATNGVHDSLPVNDIDGKVLHPDLINANMKAAQYAVRGELYLKGEELRKAGREILYTNVGNPHSVGGKPITFTRQVLALLAAPFLMEGGNLAEAAALFPADAIARARQLLSYFPGGIGAYSDSRGAPGIRAEVAEFITKRDGGVPSSPDEIFLTEGASPSVKYILNALLRDARDGILTPIPQYPLYSACIKQYGGQLVPYELDEARGWGMDVADLKSRAAAARASGVAVRALVFINPGNPTGQCLSEENLRDIVRFAHEEKVVLMADEVYQENTYLSSRPFVSAKKVLKSMGEPYASSVELVSFHTVSKGATGECGLRGGYMETVNILPETIAEIYKISSINLCPNTMGQAAVALMVTPPPEGGESRELYLKERSGIIAQLSERAKVVADAFNACEGVTCNPTEGAMYSFPQIHLPQKALAAAKAAGKSPDTWYCLKLVEETGILTVPGSGFGQHEGTFHLRTTILPSDDRIKKMVADFGAFHKKFMDEYRD